MQFGTRQVESSRGEDDANPGLASFATGYQYQSRRRGYNHVDLLGRRRNAFASRASADRRCETMSVVIRARFDGKVLIPDEPFNYLLP